MMPAAPASPVAANPRHGRPPRFLIGGGLLAATVVAMAAGSIVDVGLGGAGIGVIDLIALVPVAGVGLLTMGMVAVFDRRDRAGRRRDLLGVLAAAGAVFAALLVATGVAAAGLAIGPLLVCLPTTLLALMVVRRLDRLAKEPWRLILVAFGWGAVVATNLAVLSVSIYDRLVAGALIPGPGQEVATALSAACREEVSKGLAVLVLFTLMRNEFDDVVDGIVYGAAVGIGFNYFESAQYIGLYGGSQWVNRQVIGLFTGHAIYTAMIGAGIGVARQVRPRWGKAAMIGAGFATAIGGHFAWDAWVEQLSWLPGFGSDVVVVPTALFEGPMFLAAAAMLVLGLRREGRALRRQLQAEAAGAGGTVLPDEVEVLVHPRRRWLRRLAAALRRGPAAYFRMGRLQRAQLALAVEMWHRERQELDTPLEAEHLLRHRVLSLRAALAGRAA